MKKFVLILLFFTSLLFAIDVAKIGNKKITRKMLENKMKELKGTYEEKSEKALTNIIDDELIIEYAEQNGIIVNEIEVDQFFISIFQNESDFQTNNKFDYQKFLIKKRKPRIKSIMAKMNHDLLLKKTKAIILEMLEPSEDQLKARFNVQNTSFEVKYAKLNQDLINVPDFCDPLDVMDFYQEHKFKYLTDQKVKINYYIIQDNEFFPNDFHKENIAEIAEDSLAVQNYQLTLKRADQFAYTKAKSTIKTTQNNEEILYPVIKSDWLNKDSQIGNFQNSADIISNAYQLSIGEFAEPIRIKNGYLVYQLIELSEPKAILNDEIKEQVWKDYVTYKKANLYTDKYNDFFNANIDSFLVDVAVVTKIEIDPQKIITPRRYSSSELSNYYNSHLETYTFENEVLPFDKVYDQIIEAVLRERRQNKIDEIVQKIMNSEYSLSYIEKKLSDISSIEYPIIYLDKFKNIDLTHQTIADSINANEFQANGKFEINDKIVIYKINTIFENYIPDFDDIKDYVYLEETGINQTTIIDTTALRNYYNENPNKFFSEDSLRLGGVFYKFTPDSIFIHETEIKKYYNEHKSDFTVVRTFDFDVISYPTGTTYIDTIYNYLEMGMNFQDLKILVSHDAEIGQSQSSLNKIPREFQKVLQKMKLGEFSKPLCYKDFDYIVKLNDITKNDIHDYEKARPFIDKILKNKYAKIEAFHKAKVIFDSTKYFSHVYKFADSLNIYKFEIQTFDKDFGIFGNLRNYKTELVERVYQYQKMDRYIRNEKGIGVVFPLRRSRKAKIPFEEAKPLIKNFIQQEEDYQLSSNFVSNIKRRIEEGTNPDSLLFFLNGWKDFQETKNEISSNLFVNLLQEDISKHKTGYLSHTMKLESGDYFFYKIIYLEKKNNSNYLLFRDQIRQKIIDERYQEWKDKFLRQIGFVKYF